MLRPINAVGSSTKSFLKKDKIKTQTKSKTSVSSPGVAVLIDGKIL